MCRHIRRRWVPRFPPASTLASHRNPAILRRAMAFTDRYGLTVSTASAVASSHFQDGMDRLLSFSAGAGESFAAAVQADEALAVAHTGAALVAAVLGDTTVARASAERARACVAGASRRERQHVEAVHAFITGETARAF